MADLKNKKHLFFDFDDTLWDFNKNSEVVLRMLFHEFELAEKLNTDFNSFEAYYRKINLELWSKYYKRQIDKKAMREQRFHTVFRYFGYDNFQENLTITEKYISLTPHGTCLKDGCIEVLEYLKSNYTLHIITNGFREIQAIKLDGCGLRNYFKNIIISDEHDLIKPEEKIFRLAENLSSADRHECVMIGDSYESDITGALQAGWDAVYFSEKNFPGFPGTHITHLTELKKIF
jgi:putative hydrolase of the HAD superfamily